MSAALKVLLVAEGPSEFGDLGHLAGGARARRSRLCEGYVPPMLRKLLGDVAVEIDAQKVSAIGRFESPRRLAGDGDRAAKALALAATFGYGLLVFVKDVDKQGGTKKSALERKKKQREMHEEIEEGLATVADAAHVARVTATPCRMIEAWALGDTEAILEVAGKSANKGEIPARPEELWGQEQDPASKHPKCVLRRVLGGDIDKSVFEALAREASPATLRRTCPESFAPFADEVASAAGALAAGPREGKPRRPTPKA